MNITYYNGKKVKNRNFISIYNGSFLYGVNCFEGIRAYYNDKLNSLKIFDLDEHINRLFISSNAIGFNLDIDEEYLKNELIDIINKNDIQQDVYIRITFFIDGETSWSNQDHISRLISIRSLQSDLRNFSFQSLSISSFRRISSNSMPASIKAGANYLNSRYALLEAKSRGFDGALFLSQNGYISESTGSCIFFIKDETVYTPSTNCDILIGITRNRIIDLFEKNKISVIQSKIYPSDLQTFQCCFLAGTMIEIKRINKIDNIYFDVNYKLLNFIIDKLINYLYELEI